MRVMELIQKAVAEDGGFALAVMSVPTVGKRVFLRVDATIPTVMRGMTPSAATVKKAPLAVQKVRLSPVEKQLRIEAPPQTLLKVLELIPAVFEVVIHSFLPCSNSHFHTGSTSMVPYWSSMLSDSSFVNINRRLQDNAPGIFFKALTSRS